MPKKELGGISEDARRTATWTVKFALLQVAVKLANENKRAWRLVSPTFDAGRWRLALHYDPDPAKADYCGVSLLTAVELAKPINFSSAIMQFKSSTAGSKRIGSSMNTPNVHFECQDEHGQPQAIPLQVIESHDPSADLYVSVQLEEGRLSTPARIPPSLLNNPMYCDIAFTFPNVSLPLFAFKLVLVQQLPHFADLFKSGFAEGTADYTLPTSLKMLDCKDPFEGDPEEFAEFEPPKDSESPDTTAQLPPAARQLGQQLLQKRWHKVEISDCSWATFRTYLYALYYDAAGSLSRRSLARTGEKGDPTSLTVETAAYEAFSSLSRTFPDDDVLKSRGWQRAVELVDEGALAGGATVMNRILAAVREKAAQEARDAKAAVGLVGRKRRLDEDSEDSQ
ncbi:hypothetical protein NBRC10513_005453 [Rhodotorula toruloides]